MEVEEKVVPLTTADVEIEDIEGVEGQLEERGLLDPVAKEERILTWMMQLTPLSRPSAELVLKLSSDLDYLVNYYLMRYVSQYEDLAYFPNGRYVSPHHWYNVGYHSPATALNWLLFAVVEKDLDKYLRQLSFSTPPGPGAAASVPIQRTPLPHGHGILLDR